jgi:hypothetical protein
MLSDYTWGECRPLIWKFKASSMVYGSWTNELVYTNKYMGIMLQTIEYENRCLYCQMHSIQWCVHK